MSEQQIKVGDIVQLPSMTVELVESSLMGRTASCVWFFNSELK